MASSRYTTNLGLCNWAATDRPKRADFVADNAVIDSVLGSHIQDTDRHLSTAEKSKALEPFTVMAYAGTGESSSTVATAFRPSVAIVFKKNAPPFTVDNGVTVINSGCAAFGNGGTSGVSISTSGVVVRQESTAADGKRLNLNESGSQYTLILFK